MGHVLHKGSDSIYLEMGIEYALHCIYLFFVLFVCFMKLFNLPETVCAVV